VFRSVGESHGPAPHRGPDSTSGPEMGNGFKNPVVLDMDKQKHELSYVKGLATLAEMHNRFLTRRSLHLQAFLQMHRCGSSYSLHQKPRVQGRSSCFGLANKSIRSVHIRRCLMASQSVANCS
jgi:hypothetical protein